MQHSSSFPLPRLATVALLVAAGCGTQVSNDYLGESLLSLSGRVIVENPEAPTDLVPVLAFERPREGALPNAYLIEDVAHSGQFPSSFWLGVFEPPPAEAFFDVETPSGAALRYAWARLGAVAPAHPSVLTLTNLLESSYCLGRECYTERSRCDLEGECYAEREHCSLPSWFDARGLEQSLCSEVRTGGDIAAVPVSPFDHMQYEDERCADDVCERTYEWCRLPPGVADVCVERPDGSCRPAAENCFSRTVACTEDTSLPMLPPELDEMRWRERDDLTNCSVVSRQGNLDYAAHPNEWLAGLSNDVEVVYLPEGFDPSAFEQVLGPAPARAGYSALVLEPWNDVNTAAYQVCADRELPLLVDAYDREHGTHHSLADGVDASTELGGLLLERALRCSRDVRGAWQPESSVGELTLAVRVPPAFE